MGCSTTSDFLANYSGATQATKTHTYPLNNGRGVWNRNPDSTQMDHKLSHCLICDMVTISMVACYVVPRA